MQCGKPVGERDAFCGSCGSAQPGRAKGAWAPASLSGLAPSTASTLCYLPFLGWIMGLVVLASESYRRDLTTRFHAFQGLFLFIAYQVVDKILGPYVLRSILHFPPASLLKLLVIGAGIWLMVTTSRGEKVSLPLLGDLAEKAASEQS